MIRFFVPQLPQGKQSPRIVKIGPLSRMKRAPKTVAYEGLIAYTARQEMGDRPPWDEPMVVRLLITMPVPASWSAKKRAACLAGAIRPTVKPDCSNVLKAVEDGCNGVVFRDDALVTQVAIRKVYGEIPGVKVEILPLIRRPDTNTQTVVEEPEEEGAF